MNTNTYTIQQYAAYKNVSVNTIRNWIKQKKVNATKKDNQWFITCTNTDTNTDFTDASYTGGDAVGEDTTSGGDAVATASDSTSGGDAVGTGEDSTSGGEAVGALEDTPTGGDTSTSTTTGTSADEGIATASSTSTTN